MEKSKQKIKSPYERFLEEYVASVVPANNKQGFKIKYVYCGNWYLWNLPEVRLKKEKKILIAEYICGVIAFILTAVLVRDTNSLLFVAVPAIIAMLALFMETFGICQFRFAQYRVSRSTYAVTNRRMRLYPFLLTLSAGAAALGAIYYTVRYGFTIDRLSAFVGYAATAVAGYFVYTRYRKIPFTTEKNDTIKHIEVAG